MAKNSKAKAALAPPVRTRQTVLVLKTIDELAAMLTGPTKIGVSRKSLKAALLKQESANLSAKHGI